MDNLFDICLESVIGDYYIEEGFIDKLKTAGKFVVKGLAKAIDFLINVARQLVNIFANVIRKIRGKDPKFIEDKHIFENFVTISKKVKKIKHDIAKDIANSNNVKVYADMDQAKKSNNNMYQAKTGGQKTDDDNISDHAFSRLNNIKDRHSAAAKVMNDAYKNIMEDFVKDLDDIDSMKKQMPNDMKVSEDLVDDIKETTKKSNDLSMELDDLLKDLGDDTGGKKKVSKKFDNFMKNGGTLKFE